MLNQVLSRQTSPSGEGRMFPLGAWVSLGDSGSSSVEFRQVQGGKSLFLLQAEEFDPGVTQNCCPGSDK